MDKVTRSVHKPQPFLKRKERRSGIEPRSFRLPAHTHTHLPLGQTGPYRGLHIMMFLIQTHKMFKITLFIRTKHNMQIFGVKSFIKLQNEHLTLSLPCLPRCHSQKKTTNRSAKSEII